MLDNTRTPPRPIRSRLPLEAHISDHAIAAIAIDLGGTRTRVALVDRQGIILERLHGPTNAHLGREQALEHLLALLRRLEPDAVGARPVGIGVSLAGPVDPTTGTVHAPPNLPGWDGFSPVGLLQGAFGLPVRVVNDASLAAVGEHTFGVGVGTRDLVYVTVSTGIGGGMVSNGEPVLGSRGFAGEVGHMTLVQDGPECSCGKRGCLEALASGTALARNAAARMPGTPGSLLWQLADGNAGDVDARAVLEAAAMGDQLATELRSAFTGHLGAGLANLLNIFDPDVLVLGGGVSRSIHTFFPELVESVRRHAMAHLQTRVPIAYSVLGDDAALLGAAQLAFRAADGSG